MNNNLKTVIVAALVASLITVGVLVIGTKLVGNQSADGQSLEQMLGAAVGITRFPNSGIAARCLNITTSAGTATACTDGTVTLTGVNTVTGAFVVDAIGSSVNIQTAGTATTTVTAAEICDNTLIEWAPRAAVSTATLPTAAALQADCLDVQGSYRDVLWENTGGAASTTAFSAGASSTIEYASSTGANGPLSGADGAIIRFQNSTTTGSTNSNMVKIKIIPFND